MFCWIQKDNYMYRDFLINVFSIFLSFLITQCDWVHYGFTWTYTLSKKSTNLLIIPSHNKERKIHIDVEVEIKVMHEDLTFRMVMSALPALSSKLNLHKKTKLIKKKLL